VLNFLLLLSIVIRIDDIHISTIEGPMRRYYQKLISRRHQLATQRHVTHDKHMQQKQHRAGQGCSSSMDNLPASILSGIIFPFLSPLSVISLLSRVCHHWFIFINLRSCVPLERTWRLEALSLPRTNEYHLFESTKSHHNNVRPIGGWRQRLQSRRSLYSRWRIGAQVSFKEIRLRSVLSTSPWQLLNNNSYIACLHKHGSGAAMAMYDITTSTAPTKITLPSIFSDPDIVSRRSIWAAVSPSSPKWLAMNSYNTITLLNTLDNDSNGTRTRMHQTASFEGLRQCHSLVIRDTLINQPMAYTSGGEITMTDLTTMNQPIIMNINGMISDHASGANGYLIDNKDDPSDPYSSLLGLAPLAHGNFHLFDRRASQLVHSIHQWGHHTRWHGHHIMTTTMNEFQLYDIRRCDSVMARIPMTYETGSNSPLDDDDIKPHIPNSFSSSLISSINKKKVLGVPQQVPTAPSSSMVWSTNRYGYNDDNPMSFFTTGLCDFHPRLSSMITFNNIDRQSNRGIMIWNAASLIPAPSSGPFLHDFKSDGDDTKPREMVEISAESRSSMTSMYVTDAQLILCGPTGAAIWDFANR
jgi:hypothetical protein